MWRIRVFFTRLSSLLAAHRDRRSLSWVEIVQQDVTYAAKQLQRAPAYALTGMLTLALCIGATVTVFTIIDDVLFRPLAYRDGDRLVTLFSRLDPFGRIPVSDGQYRVWRPSLKSFDGMALIFGYDVNLSGPEEPERVAAARVSPELFRMLGVRPQLGRLLRPDEDLPGRDRVVVVSNNLWRRRFAADPSVVGRTVAIDGEPYEIVGVLPDDFRFPVVSRLYSIPLDAARPELWKPFALAVKASVDARAIAPEVRAVVRSIDAELPLANLGTLSKVVTDSVGERRFLTLLVTLFAVGGLMLAVVGIYGVMSQSVAQRTAEIGLRIALGARQPAVVRMVLLEAVRVVGAGLLVGIPIALASGSALRAMLFEIGPNDPITIAGASLLLALAAAAAAYVPARRASRVDPVVALRSE